MAGHLYVITAPRFGLFTTLSSNSKRPLVSAHNTRRTWETRSMPSNKLLRGESRQFFGQPGAPAAQPRDQILVAAFLRCLLRCLPTISNPVQVGATLEEILRRVSLSAATRRPKGVGDLVSRRRRLVRAVFLHTIQETQRCRLPDRCSGSALEQPACGAPLREYHRI